MYAKALGTWRTSRGASAVFEYREDTNDWNCINACVTEDEYQLGPLALSGWAFDIGAHLGGVAIALALDNPSLRVVAVEPVPENAELCRANVERNHLAGRVEVIHGAIGSPGQAAITVCYGYSHSESTRHHTFIGAVRSAGHGEMPHRECQVTGYSLAALVNLVGGLPSFVKMDCEGGEWAAFMDPITVGLPRIHGEWHATEGHTRADLECLFVATHELSFQGPEAGPGGFTAVRR